jgi:hypothetical protein
MPTIVMIAIKMLQPGLKKSLMIDPSETHQGARMVNLLTPHWQPYDA